MNVCALCRGHDPACENCFGCGWELIQDMTFQYTCRACAHAYEVPAFKCTVETGPGCHCGHPWAYLIKDIVCPSCCHEPGFLERPIFTHLGIGVGNLKGITKLQIDWGVPGRDQTVVQEGEDLTFQTRKVDVTLL